MTGFNGGRTALVIVAMIGLAACGNGHNEASSGSGGPSQSGDGSSLAGGGDKAAAASAKLNGYISGYNALLSPFGLQAQYRLYAAQNLSQPVPPGRFINVSVGWLDNALSDLRSARALPKAGLGDLDAVGDRIVPDLDKLVGALKGLTIYYQSRGYIADNFARGRREDPQVIADFKASFADMDQLNQALEREIARRDQAELDSLKRDGDTVGYDGALAMQKSKALLHLFNAPEDFRNPALFQKGDALVTAIEGALADERRDLAKPKKDDDPEHGLRNSGLNTAADRLETMVGHYRDLKQTGLPFNYQMMVSAYNDAVQNTNLMQ